MEENTNCDYDLGMLYEDSKNQMPGHSVSDQIFFFKKNTKPKQLNILTPTTVCWFGWFCCLVFFWKKNKKLQPER